MSLLAETMIRQSTPGSTVVDIAPTRIVSDLLRAAVGDRYVSIDFDPAADRRLVDAQASITDLPIRSNSVGFLLCSHVLEHVPDDARAMQEIVRVLGTGGVALIQVPRRHGLLTDEDPSAPIEERKQRFGQADHVRYYGDDFEKRLEAGGLRVATITYPSVLPVPVLEVIGAHTDEELWIATTGADPLDFIESDVALRSLIDSLISSDSALDSDAGSRIRELEAQLEKARAEAESWRSHYRWLRNRPVIRFGSTTKHRLKRAGVALSGLFGTSREAKRRKKTS
jgi:SAM-dependent methyltransferase